MQDILINRLQFKEKIADLDKNNRLLGVVKKFSELDLNPEVIDGHKMGYMFEEILQQAGLNLKRGDKQHDANAFLLTVMNGESIDECNDFLESIGVETLGTHERSTTWSGNNFK